MPPQLCRETPRTARSDSGLPLRGVESIVGVPLDEDFGLIGPSRDSLERGVERGLVVVDRLELLANHAQGVQHLGERPRRPYGRRGTYRE